MTIALAIFCLAGPLPVIAAGARVFLNEVRS